MHSPPTVHSTKVRCAPFHRSTGADPVGSTGSYDAYLCVEVPLPWGRDIAEHEPFASLGAGSCIEGADGRSWRPQGLVPTLDSGGRVRVIAYEQPLRDGRVRPYMRREWWVRTAQVELLCRALIAADHRAVESLDDERVAVGQGARDLLVCTHGRRDVCCGGSGTALHDELARQLLGDDTVRLFRVSHTGGHRFAPTALTFPDGYAWAHLDLPAALGIVRRDVDVGAVVDRCRGVSSLRGPAAQVADREVLARVGWSWCDATRAVLAAEPSGPRHRSEVRIDATMPDDACLTALVQVERDGEIPQPDCGSGRADDAPTASVWRAVRVDRLPAG